MAKTDGTWVAPPLNVMTRGLPADMMAAHEFVVPRSMPIAMAIS